MSTTVIEQEEENPLRQQHRNRRSTHSTLQRPQVEVGVIISRAQRVLLLSRRSTFTGERAWSTPVGCMEYGESLQQCALRVAQEEAGVTITNIVFRAITNDVFEAQQQHALTIWMEGTPLAAAPIAQAFSEPSTPGWFSWDALPEPLYLPLEHLLTGQCDPAPWNFSEEGAP